MIYVLNIFCSDDGASGYTTTSLANCGYYAQWPASSPYVVTVGGTMNGIQRTGTPEIVCSRANSGSTITTGGGFSNSITASSFQSAAISSYLKLFTPIQSTVLAYNSNNRAYPDLSMPGNMYQIAINNKWALVDGTSAAAPVFAGMVSAVNAVLMKRGKSSLGWLNPSIYAANGYFTFDVTSGDTKCTNSNLCCTSVGYSATVGFDLATGWGSVNFPKFLAYFTNSSFTSPPTLAPISSPPTVNPTISSKPTASPTLPPNGLPQTSYFATTNPRSCPSISISKYRVTCYSCVSNVTNYLSVTNPTTIRLSTSNLFLYVQAKNSIKAITVNTKSITNLVNCK